MMNKLVIRPLKFEDYSKWLPLWDGNNIGQRDEACDRRNLETSL